MNIIQSGKSHGKLDLPATITIGSIKDYFNTHFPNNTIKLTFSNGQELSPIVWQSNTYDNTDLQQQKDFLKGGTIELTPPVTPQIQQPQIQQPVVDIPIHVPATITHQKIILTTTTEKREYLFGNILTTVDDYNHDRILAYGDYHRYIELFPTYHAFVEGQRDYLANLPREKLDYLVRLMINSKNGKVEYMDMEGASPGMTPDGFFLIDDGIVIVAQR